MRSLQKWSIALFNQKMFRSFSHIGSNSIILCVCYLESQKLVCLEGVNSSSLGIQCGLVKIPCLQNSRVKSFASICTNVPMEELGGILDAAFLRAASDQC